MVSAPGAPWSDLAGSAEGWAVDGVAPRLRARPATAEELADTLRQADADGLAVAPRGGGTHLDLGNPPARLDLVLETGGLDRVVEYEPADLTVTVEAGMPFRRLQATLAEQGQMLALDPPVAEEATIGGLVATNASGPLRYAFGSPRDLVIGTRVANPDGALTRAGGRVVKNVAGYDLSKLHIGGLGTLGVLVELSFKLAPLPPASGVVVGAFASPAAARDLLLAVTHSPLSPLALQLLGRRAAGAAGLASGADGAVVVMRLGGYPEAVARLDADLGRLVERHGGRRLEASDGTWDAVARLAREAHSREVVVKAAVPPAESARLVETLEAALAAFEPVVWSEAGNGVAHAACAAGEGLAEALQSARRQVVAIGGQGGNASLVVWRSPTLVKRAVDAWGDPGDGLALTRALKSRLDPRGTLNPGRFVGGI